MRVLTTEQARAPEQGCIHVLRPIHLLLEEYAVAGQHHKRSLERPPPLPEHATERSQAVFQHLARLAEPPEKSMLPLPG